MRFLFNDKPLERGKFGDFPITVAGNDLPDKDTVYLFDSEGNLTNGQRLIILKKNSEINNDYRSNI